MKFRKFGKTVLTAALSSAIVFSLSSCVRSFTVGYMYVTGTVTATPTGNGIITGFKIDNNTGMLRALHGLPVSSGGANPVRAVLLSGGNFVYVLNRGANKEGNLDCTVDDPCLNSNITEFVVGGNGILTPQQTFFTQGLNPFRLLSDTSGTHLFVLDHDAPSNAYCGAVILGATTCGDITVFSVDPTTGRLTLVTNTVLTTVAGNNVTYFPVPANPIDFAYTTSYVITMSGAATANPTPATGQTVYPYQYNASSGQLTISPSAPDLINNGAGGPMGQGTAIVYASGKVYILDNEPLTAGGTPGQIIPFTIGTNGALQSLVGGAIADDVTETNPIYLMVESKGKFLYVANQDGFGSTNSAGIAAYSIDPSSGILTPDPGSPIPTTGTGRSPQCLLEDPSNQYVYTANSDNTVTGHVFSPKDGLLTTMKGAGNGTFQLTGPATWCIVTGRTN